LSISFYLPAILLLIWLPKRYPKKAPKMAPAIKTGMLLALIKKPMPSPIKAKKITATVIARFDFLGFVGCGVSVCAVLLC